MSSTVLQSISFDLEHSVLLLNYVLAEPVLIFFFFFFPSHLELRVAGISLSLVMLRV